MSQNQGYEVFDGLAQQVPAIPAGSVVTRMVFANPHVKVMMVGFAPGEKIIEGIPEQPAILEVWRGEGVVTLGEEAFEIGAGSWVYIDAKTPHTIEARSELVCLLTLIRDGSDQG